MPIQHTKASPSLRQLLESIQEKNHPHLEQALIAFEFVDSKPFIKDRINLGKVTKFSPAAKMWFPDNAKYDFCISACTDVWFGLLNEKQREAWIDLQLGRCQVEYEPNTVVVNGKKQTVRDEFGRVEYTQDIKTDDEGLPVWKVLPLDIGVIAENVKRYGLWYSDLLELKQAIESHHTNDSEEVS